MIDHHSLFLLISALVSVIGLILLIAVAKLNPFITLLVVSLALAIVAGMPADAIIHSFEAGLG
ncbi:MAG: permease DsdX, partial [Acidobacteriaceae bacterium]